MILVPFLLLPRLSANHTVQLPQLLFLPTTPFTCFGRFASYCDLTAPEIFWSVVSPCSLENIHVFFLTVSLTWWKCGIWKCKGFNFISFYFHWWKWNNFSLTSGINLFLKSCGLSLIDKILCCQDRSLPSASPTMVPNILFLQWKVDSTGQQGWDLCFWLGQPMHRAVVGICTRKPAMARGQGSFLSLNNLFLYPCLP